MTSGSPIVSHFLRAWRTHARTHYSHAWRQTTWINGTWSCESVSCSFISLQKTNRQKQQQQKKDLNDQCLPGLGSLVHCPDTPSPQST